jgi:hypothetical protein
MCAAGHSNEVSNALRSLLVDKRQELAPRIDENALARPTPGHLVGQLEAGTTPRAVITLRKEAEDATAL